MALRVSFDYASCMKLAALVIALASVACSTSDAKPTPSPAKPPVTRFEIAVTDEGFKPDDVKVPAATPITLVFTRKTDQTCAKEVIITTGGKKIQKELPLDKPVEISATFPTAGKLSYACSMDMVKATLTVQ